MDRTVDAVVVGDGDARRVVVEAADDEIWIDDAVMAAARKGPTLPGGLERDRDMLTFGTPDEGIGRVTYRITGQVVDGFHHRWTVAERVS